MGDSFQNEVPTARVNIKLDLHTGGVQKKVELPLKLLTVGDFSNGREQRPLSEREKVDINKNNFNDVLAKFSPVVNLSVKNTLAGDDRKDDINLTFKNIRDFEPEQVARNIPQLRVLLAMRNLLRDLKSNLLDTRLLNSLGENLPRTNFYRFCQLLEQGNPQAPGPGSQQSPRFDAIRFRPHPGMGFPAGELKSAEYDPQQPTLPPTVRVTFMGLYGVESPLPTTYQDDIAQRQEGSDVAAEFLDIFNHRLITQFYRIWRKYSYPATFRPGGTDETSQYLLGLTGLGIPGCGKQTETPLSRFLALLGIMRMPTRTAEGISALVSLLSPTTNTTVTPHDKRLILLDKALKMSTRQPVSLHSRPVMGRSAVDINSQVLITLTTSVTDEVRDWLPGGQLYHDFLALMHVYLGARVNARLQLRIPRSALPHAQLTSNKSERAVQLGRTAVMRLDNPETKNQHITIKLGLWQSLSQHDQRREADETGDYRY